MSKKTELAIVIEEKEENIKSKNNLEQNLFMKTTKDKDDGKSKRSQALESSR